MNVYDDLKERLGTKCEVFGYPLVVCAGTINSSKPRADKSEIQILVKSIGEAIRIKIVNNSKSRDVRATESHAEIAAVRAWGARATTLQAHRDVGVPAGEIGRMRALCGLRRDRAGLAGCR